MFLSKEWIQNVKPTAKFSKVKCFPNGFQEPYVMVKKDDSEIRFNPSFVNYGCNKVQFIEHLRATGKFEASILCIDHSFYLLNNAFATDISHHE